MQVADQVAGHLLPVLDEGPHVGGVEHLAHDVAVRLDTVAQPVEHPRQAWVGHQHVPVPVHHEGGEGLLLGQDELDGPSHQHHLRIRQGGLAIAGRVAGDDQQGVAIAHRHVQHPGQQGDQFAAGPGLAGFHIAEVAGRDPGLQRQVHLAHPAGAPPLAQQVAQGMVARGAWHGGGGARRRRGHRVHDPTLTAPGMIAITSQVMEPVIGRS
jgi:hypothetical protein